MSHKLSGAGSDPACSTWFVRSRKLVHSASIGRWMAVWLIGITCCVLMAGASAGAAEKQWLVYLLPMTPNEQRVSLMTLSRELIRESILLSAREEFGALTRDADCGESLPNDLSDYAGVLKIEPTVTSIGPIRISLEFSTIGPDGEQTATSQGNLTFGQVLELRDYEKTIERCEVSSRGDAIEVLRTAGLPVRKAGGIVVEDDGTGRLPAGQPQGQAELERRLNEMCLFAQFDVLREVHPLLLAQPQSGELLTMVSRGYAHLGQMTRCHFDSSFNVYVARSLLYAQRLVQKDNASQRALLTRAYAKALTGLHASALDDVKLAQQAGKAGQPAQGNALPPWAEAAEMLCRYQRQELEALASKAPAISGLAGYFAFLTVEHESSPSLVIRTALNAMKSAPHCLRLLEGASAKAGVSYLHQLTTDGFPIMAKMIDQEWAAMEAGMPPVLRDAHTAAKDDPDAVASVADITHALLTCDVPSEPSWSMLGNLMDQTSFMLVHRRAHFMSYYWSVPTDDYLAKMKPLYQGHPLGQYMLSFGDEYRNDPGRRAKYLADLNINIDGWFPQMLPLVVESQGPFAQGLFITYINGISRTDYDWTDVLVYLRFSDDPDHVEIIQQAVPLLMQLSPYDPLPAMILIGYDWPKAKQSAARWEEELKGSPLFWGAMARRAMTDHQPLEAAGYLEKYVAIAPDIEALHDLSDCYKAAGKLDKCLLTLQRALQEEDYGLMHAHTQLRLAAYYRSIGKDDRCIAYAEEAASTGAEWAMVQAGQFHEQLDHWDRAEELYRETASRYDDYEPWYQYCVRSGRGDRAMVAKAVELQYKRGMESPTRDGILRMASFLIEEGRLSQAIPMLRQAIGQYQDAWAALILASVADPAVSREQKMQALRECSVAQTSDAHPNEWIPKRPYLNSLAGMMAKAMREHAMLDGNTVEALKKEAPAEEWPNLQYPVAMYMIQNGQEAGGIALLKECVSQPNFVKNTWQFARDELRQRKMSGTQTTAPAAAPAAAADHGRP